MKLAGDAVRDYFTREKIDPRPRYDTIQIVLSWEHRSRKHLGVYSAATQSLQVWVEVPSHTENAAIINGGHYIPVA
jgi:hypothetical protein